MNLDVEDIFNKNVLLPFEKRSRGRVGIQAHQMSLSITAQMMIASFKELLVANHSGIYSHHRICVTADFLAIEGYWVANVDFNIDMTNPIGAGGLDQGTEEASTWYAIWVIYDVRTGVVSGLFSKSKTNPVMPSGYSKKRRLGWIRNDSVSNFWPLIYQKGTSVFFCEPMSVLTNGSAEEWATVSCSSVIPVTAAEVKFSGLVERLAEATATLHVCPTPFIASSDGYIPLECGTAFGSDKVRGPIEISLDGNRTFSYNFGVPGAQVSIWAYGYSDPI